MVHRKCRKPTVWHCRFDMRDVVMLQQLAAALAQMHQHYLVHQDLHAANILLTQDGSACKISDLGSAQYRVIDGQPNCLSSSM